MVTYTLVYIFLLVDVFRLVNQLQPLALYQASWYKSHVIVFVLLTKMWVYYNYHHHDQWGHQQFAMSINIP